VHVLTTDVDSEFWCAHAGRTVSEFDPADPYTQEGADEARHTAALPKMRELAAQALTRKEIADALELDEARVRRSPHSIAEPNAAHDARVQQALFEAAVGGAETWREAPTKDGAVVRLKSEVLPNPKAAHVWMQARKPNEWAEKREVTHRIVVDRLAYLREEAIEGETVPAPMIEKTSSST
jgi:hypothetical protein